MAIDTVLRNGYEADGDWQSVEQMPSDFAQENIPINIQKASPEATARAEELRLDALKEPDTYDLQLGRYDGDVLKTIQSVMPINQATATDKVKKLQGIMSKPLKDAAFDFFQNPKAWSEYADVQSIAKPILEQDEKGHYLNPNTVNLMMNPNTAALTKDNTPELLEIEQNAKSMNPEDVQESIRQTLAFKDSIWSVIGSKLNEGGKEVGKVGISFMQWAVNSSEKMGKQQLEMQGRVFTPEEEKGIKAEGAKRAEYYKNWRAGLDTIQPEYVQGYKKYVGDVAAQIPQIGAVIGASILGGPGAGATFMAGYIGYGQYGQLMDYGATHETSQAAGLINALFQLPMEYIPLSKFTKIFKTKYASPADYAKEYLSLLIAEPATEFLQQYPDEITTTVAQMKTKGKSALEIAEVVWKELPETTKDGLYAGLVMLPIGAAMGTVGIPGIIKQSNYLRGQQDMAARSKLKQTNPELYGDISAINASNNAIKGEVSLTKAGMVDALGDKYESTIKSLGVDDSKNIVNIPLDKWGKILAGTPEAKALMDLQDKELDRKITEHSGQVLSPEQMTKAELLQELNLTETTQERDELEAKITFNRALNESKKPQAVKDLVNVIQELGKDLPEIKMITEDINVLDLLKGDIAKANQSAVDSGIETTTPGDLTAKGAYIKEFNQILMGRRADPETFGHEFLHFLIEEALDDGGNIKEDHHLRPDMDVLRLLDKEYDLGIFGKNDTEALSYLSQKNIEGGISERILNKIKKIPKLYQILEYIKSLYTKITKHAETLAELIKLGKVPPNIVDLLDRAMTGNLSQQEVNDTVNNIPKMQEQAKAVEEVEQTLGKSQETTEEQPQKSFSTRNPFEKMLKACPVLNYINEFGKIESRPKNYKGGEYDGMPDNLKGYYALFMSKTGGKPDIIAQRLQEEGLISDGYPDTMWQAIEGEINGYKKVRDDETAHDKALNQEGKQADNFSKDTAQKSDLNKKKVEAETLKVGDKVTVKHKSKGKEVSEVLEVISVDPDTYEVELKDHTRYGIQELNQGEAIYAAKVSSPVIRHQIDAYHGSPHSFDKFSLDKIGTGEGNQSFGYGLYFTDTEDIARNYAERLSDKDALIGDKKISELREETDNPVFNWIKIWIADSGGKFTKADIVENLNKNLQDKEWLKNNAWAESKIKAALEYIKDKNIEEIKGNKKLYQVTLHKGKTPDQYDYLEWEKPLTDEQKKKIADLAVKEGVNIAYQENGKNILNTSNKPTGEQIYHELGKSFVLGSDKKASEFLLRAGIDGIKYSAGTLSGITNSDAYNYVVFDDKAVSVKHIVRFQAEQIKKEKENWIKELQAYKDGNYNPRHNARIMSFTPEILQMYGVKNLPISIHPNVLRKILFDKHDITFEQLEQLVDQINEPTVIFDSNPNDERAPREGIVIFTDMLNSEKKPIMIGLLLDKKEGNYKVNNIGSIYGKRNLDALSDWYNLGLLRWVNIKKVSKWPYSARKRLPGDSTIRNSKDILTPEKIKSNSDSQTIRTQISTVQEVLQDYIKAYSRLRKADNVFKQFNSTFYMDKTHELKTELLGRIEDLTGKQAPIGYDEKYDEYIAGASKHLNYIKSDKYATDKWAEKLKNGSIDDLKYFAEGLDLMYKDIKSMEHVAKYQKTEKRNVDQDEAGERMLREQAVKVAKDELHNNIKAIQKRVWQELSMVPKVGRDYEFLKQLVKSHNKSALKDPAQYMLDTQAFVKAQMERVEARENIEKFDDRLNFAIKKRNTPGGQKKSITVPEYHAMLQEVKAIRKMSITQAALEVQSIINLIEKENRDSTIEEGRRLIWLDTFNGLEKKTPKEIASALEQLDSLIEKGKTKRELLEEEWQKLKDTLNEKAQKVLLGSKELGTQEERNRKARADAKGWKAIKNNLETMFDSQATFEMLMNALSKNDVLSSSMHSFLNTYFATKVHQATQAEETTNRKRVAELQKDLGQIWKLDKETNPIKRAIEYNNKFRNLEKSVDKTGVFVRVPIYKKEPVNIKFSDAVKLINDYALGQKTGVFAEKFGEAENMQEIIDHLKGFVFEKVREQVKYEADLAQTNDQYAKRRKLTSTADEFTYNTLQDLIKKDEVKFDEFIEDFPMGSTDVYIMESRGKLEEIAMSQAEAIQYWLSAQQQDVLEKMFINGWDDTNIKQLDKFLAPESKEIAKMLQNKYKEQYDPMNAVYKRLWWVDMPQILNYARAMYEVEKDNSETNMNDISAGGSIFTSPFATAVPKSTVERVQHRHNLKKVSALDVYLRSIAESSHFINWAELSKELRGVFKNPETRQAIKQEFGNGRMKMVDHQIDMLINGGIKQNAFDHWANIMRGYTSKIMQSGKVALIATQLTGIVNYGAYVNPVELTAELGKFWRHGRRNIKAVWKTNYIQNRAYGSGQSQEMNMLIKQGQGKPNNYFKKALDSGMIFTRTGDILVVMQGYWAVRNIKYREYIKQGMSKAEAKKQAQLDAEMISDRTQSGGGLKDQGWLQSQGGTVNLFQTFMSAQRVLFNVAKASITDAMAGREGGGQAAKAVLVTWVLNGIMFQAANDLLKNLFDWDDKYSPDWRDYVSASLIGPLNSIPIIASLLSTAARKVSGQYTGNWTPIPGTGAIVDVVIDGITSMDAEQAVKGLERSTGVGQTVKLVSGGYEKK